MARSKIKTPWRIIVYIFLTISSIIMVYPFVWMIFSSFKDNLDLVQQPFKLIIPGKMTFENYMIVLNRLKLPRAYFNSLIVTFLDTGLVLFTSAIAGFIFSKFKFKGREVLFFIFLGILMFPPYIIVIPLYIFVNKLGLLNTYLGLAIPFMVDAFGVFLIRQFMLSIPNSLIESAEMDAAGNFRIFRSIVLPLSRSPLSVLAILIFLWNWDRFIWPIVVSQTENMRTLPVLLAHFNQTEADMPAPSMAAAALSILPILIVYFIFQRNFIKGIAMTGLKY